MTTNYYLGALLLSSVGTIVLGFYLGIFFERTKDGKIDTKSILGGLGFVFVVLLVISMVIAVLLTAFPPPTYETQSRVINTSIYSLNVNQDIKGHFFIGSGSIEGVEKYTFYKDAGGGGVVRESVPTQGTVIYQDEDQNPYLKKTSYVDVNVKTGEEINEWRYVVSYELHVPRGTVVEEYRI